MSNYKIKRPLPIGNSKKGIGLKKDELYTMHSYLINDESKGNKKSAIKRNIKFEDYTNCLKNNGTILKPQQMSEVKHLFTEKVNKIALNANVSNIQVYFEIIKKHEKLTVNPPIQNYINNWEQNYIEN